jgi:type VI secretion system secreted protein Hcp
MALGGYASINGATQGNITAGDNSNESVGNNYQTGFEDQCFVSAFTGEVNYPVDPLSGAPTGGRSHLMATLTKPLSKSTPLLNKAATTGEMLQIQMDLYRTSAAGSQEKFFTIKWTDAIIVQINGVMANPLIVAQANVAPSETVGFRYRKVEWDHVICGTSGSDDWRAPNQG